MSLLSSSLRNWKTATAVSLTSLPVLLLVRQAIKNQANPSIPHTERRAFVGCLDGRLVYSHFLEGLHLTEDGTLHFGTDFIIRMAGGAAALLTERDGEACLGQLMDAYAVRPFAEVTLQLHMPCGKLELCAGESGEFGDDFQHTSLEKLINLGERARQIVVDAFQQRLGVDMAVTVTVVELTRTFYGMPKSKVLITSGGLIMDASLN